MIYLLSRCERYSVLECSCVRGRGQGVDPTNKTKIPRPQYSSSTVDFNTWLYLMVPGLILLVAVRRWPYIDTEPPTALLVYVVYMLNIFAAAHSDQTWRLHV